MFLLLVHWPKSIRMFIRFFRRYYLLDIDLHTDKTSHTNSLWHLRLAIGNRFIFSIQFFLRTFFDDRNIVNKGKKWVCINQRGFFRWSNRWQSSTVGGIYGKCCFNDGQGMLMLRNEDETTLCFQGNKTETFVYFTY